MATEFLDMSAFDFEEFDYGYPAFQYCAAINRLIGKAGSSIQATIHPTESENAKSSSESTVIPATDLPEVPSTDSAAIDIEYDYDGNGVHITAKGKLAS
ncbi:hypothetical protein G7Z17_g10947 [Cylindrodendrum hubeiense]|uniref:Uncharacterized protein n=1 Tax=Cylindrodendrum hubeiense TaxID=595255 RepID=A0A9P5H0I5_9HYPO|nr:hypothetical protein G7Z17_g10947 [Cylindrodendrum hubeiense]